MPISYITHRDKKILFVDLSESKTEQRSLELLEEAKSHFIKANEKLLVLTYSEGTFVNSKVTTKMKEYGKKYFRDGAKRRPFVGITGIKKILFKAYMKIVGGEAKAFDNLDEAKEYLVS